MRNGRCKVLCMMVVLLMATPSLQADHHIVDVVVTVESLVPENGVYFSPVWVGFHDGNFDLFDVGSLASEGVERIAEDGNVSVLQEDFAAVTGKTGIDGVITSPAGFEGLPVFDPGESSTAEFTLTAGDNRYMSFASMVVPSNDAFIGNHNPWAIELFDAAGTFKGKQIITIPGSMVWDAGTELNTEMDAAFINQTAPNTGVTTASPILSHPGYLGSYGNPGGDPIVLSSVNAAGTLTDPVGADFTLPYAVVARITIERAPMAGMELMSAGDGATTANGWYETEEIYYILGGVEEGITELGENDLYLIGGDRKYQANVAEFIPGEPGYSPHWNVNFVQTAAGVTLKDILDSPYVSAHYPEALFDDVEDILDAQAAGLVTIDHLGVVVLCPIISKEAAEAPGNTPLSEEFPPFPEDGF